MTPHLSGPAALLLVHVEYPAHADAPVSTFFEFVRRLLGTYPVGSPQWQRTHDQLAEKLSLANILHATIAELREACALHASAALAELMLLALVEPIHIPGSPMPPLYRLTHDGRGYRVDLIARAAVASTMHASGWIP